MCPNVIPIRLVLTDICVTALLEIADGLEDAHDMACYLEAMDSNHRLWRAVTELGATEGWIVPHHSEFAIHLSSTGGRGVDDGDIDALVAINRRMARSLAGTGDIARIRTRVRLAYRESGCNGFCPWLLAQMDKKVRVCVLAATGGERDTAVSA